MEKLTQPKVSVVIPVYNVEKYLEECIKSIQNQTLKELEIICVNDGSPDGSLAILERLAKDDDRIVIINQENAGAGAARNNGVKHARGKYIGFVDSDDSIEPNMYEEMYEKAEATDAEMVISGEIETTEGDNMTFPLAASEVKPEYLELGTFRAIEYPEILQNVFLWNRLYLRSFWMDNQLVIPEKRKFAEDVLICTQTSVLPKKVAYVKGPHYHYRNFREDSLSDTLAKSQKKLDYLIAVDETKKFLKSTGAYDFYAHNFLIFAVHLFIINQRRITNMKCHAEFFRGMADILDEDDFEVIDNTWVRNAYPEMIRALKTKNARAICRKNQIRCFFGRK